MLRSLSRLQTVSRHLARPAIAPTARTMASQNIPSTMKAVQIQKTGGVEVLEYVDIPVPTPKDDEVLIKNEIIGVNYIDNYFRTGLYKAPSFPYTLGREGAGTIVAPASNLPHGLQPGGRVVYSSTSAYAEYTAVPAKTVVSIPDSISTQDACAALLQGLTALTLVEEAHKVQKGDWVLVHAAAGGTGGWLVQLIAARGGHVIATASSEEKRELARGYGAEVVVSYDDVEQTVVEKTDGKGVIAVFDGVGKVTFDQDLRIVARKGTVVSFGNASGAVEPLAIARLSEKNVKVARPALFNYLATKEEWDHYSAMLWDIMAGGKIKVPVHKVYALSDVAQAHTDIQGRGTIGKLLLKP